MALLFATCGAVAGAGGLAFFWSGLRAGGTRGRFAVGTVLLCTFTVVLAQMTWSLRPYLVRPRADEVPLVRAVEGSLPEAILHSVDSARGIYYREAAPLPGEDAP